MRGCDAAGGGADRGASLAPFSHEEGRGLKQCALRRTAISPLRRNGGRGLVATPKSACYQARGFGPGAFGSLRSLCFFQAFSSRWAAVKNSFAAGFDAHRTDI
jgi:hypothetical protein